MRWLTKAAIAYSKAVTPRTVDLWVEKGLLDKPLKLGRQPQSRVRWTEAQVEALDKRLTDAT